MTRIEQSRNKIDQSNSSFLKPIVFRASIIACQWNITIQSRNNSLLVVLIKTTNLIGRRSYFVTVLCVSWNIINHSLWICNLRIWSMILTELWSGPSFTAARKSSLKLVKLRNLVAKCCKTWKIWLWEICRFCMYLYYARKKLPFLPRKW